MYSQVYCVLVCRVQQEACEYKEERESPVQLAEYESAQAHWHIVACLYRFALLHSVRALDVRFILRLVQDVQM